MKNLCRTMLRATATLAVASTLVLSQPAHAAGGGYSDSGNYNFSLPGFQGLGGGGSAPLFEANFNAGGGFDLGCGGIGLFDFVQSTFNLNNIMSQFKASMQTMLAKTLMTQLMSMPALSAMFDTLNAFGNARFDLFQQSCNIGEIREEAKQICIDKCVAKGIAPDLCRDQECNNSGGMLADVTKDMKKMLYENEHINEALRGDLCKDQDGSINPKKKDTCFLMALLPQMRLCLRSSIGESCPSEGYGATNPPVTVSKMLATGYSLTGAYVNPSQQYFLSAQHRSLSKSVRMQAARFATIRASNGEKPAGLSAPTAAPAGDESTDRLIKEFKSTITCNEEDIFVLPGLYDEELRKLSGGAGLPSLNKNPDINSILSQFDAELSGNLKDVYANDMKALKEIIRLDTTCQINTKGIMSPFVWNTLAESNPGVMEDFLASLSEEVGHQVALDVAQFTANWLGDKIPGLEIPELTRPPEATKADTEDDEEYKEEKQKDAAEIIQKSKKEAATEMVKRLEQYIEAEKTRYLTAKTQRRNNCKLAGIAANTASMDNGLPPIAVFCAD